MKRRSNWDRPIKSVALASPSTASRCVNWSSSVDPSKTIKAYASAISTCKIAASQTSEAPEQWNVTITLSQLLYSKSTKVVYSLRGMIVAVSLRETN